MVCGFDDSSDDEQKVDGTEVELKGKNYATLDLREDVVETTILNGTFTKLRIRRNRGSSDDTASKSADKSTDDSKDTPSEKNEEEDETPEQTTERLCKPENWPDLFSYRRETDRWASWKSIKRKEFWSNTDGRDDENRSMCLVKPYGGGSEKLILWSKFICDLYQTVTAPHDFYNTDVYYVGIEISSPYAPLFHCLDAMKEEMSKNPDVSPLQGADFNALETLSTTGIIGNSYKNVRQNLEQGVISLSQIWAVYRPKELIVVNDIGLRGVQSIMRVASIKKKPAGLVDPGESLRDWILTTTQISWDGTRFREEMKKIVLPAFSGYKKITDLKVVPLRCHPDADSLKEKALARGLRYQKCCVEPARAMYYRGLAAPLLVDRKVGLDEELEPEQISISGRVVVDPKALVRAAKLGNLESNSIGKTLFTTDSSTDTLGWMKDIFIANTNLKAGAETQAPEFILLPPIYPVFTLDEQEWLYISVEKLEDIQWQKEAFQRLELDSIHKDLLGGLVKSHALGQEKRTKDMISGKGAGLIMLFYGPPGTGKTLTAEALGEISGKALYKINLGLVSEHRNWEAVLDNIFACAHAWNCILLIDEAEVVLEARSVQGRSQNNWVSVFLRKIEYFQGILILTTNIVEVIDEAFQSRISIGIEYASLDNVARLNIWKAFIERMDSSISNKSALLKTAPEWAEEELNARQIRNVILTTESVILGRGKRAKVEPEDIQAVLNQQLGFIERVGDCKRGGQKLLRGVIQY